MKEEQLDQAKKEAERKEIEKKVVKEKEMELIKAEVAKPEPIVATATLAAAPVPALFQKKPSKNESKPSGKSSDLDAVTAVAAPTPQLQHLTKTRPRRTGIQAASRATLRQTEILREEDAQVAEFFLNKPASHEAAVAEEGAEKEPVAKEVAKKEETPPSKQESTKKKGWSPLGDGKRCRPF